MKTDHHYDARYGYAQGDYGYSREAQACGYAVEPHHPYAQAAACMQEGNVGSGGAESWVNFRNPSYLKGFVVGAGVALVLSNPAVQKALVTGVVKLWSTVQGGVEEVKEQIQDIKAEMSQKG